MLSGDGKITGYIGTSTDIHLQKTLTQQLNTTWKKEPASSGLPMPALKRPTMN
jgi:hypothetical protein